MKKNNDINKSNYVRPQTCRNCGINGHLYKDCIHPVMSFGIICYKIENSEIKYLMVQRKDSLAFMEFVRGKYDISNISYITELIAQMTINEKKLLSNNDFDIIWNYAWCQTNINIKHTSEYIESKKKYNILIQNNTLINILKELVNINNEQEWGFPKGRRKLKESNIDCAIREFCEETRILKTDIDIKKELNNFEEIFYGSNNILYKHVYYVAKINKKVKLIIDSNCMEQVREIRALEWNTFKEVLNKIKKKNIERIEIFKLTDKLIKDIENIN
jgi:8-oxo-dGTP pyrophosphatase MutT (NUDIX family)